MDDTVREKLVWGAGGEFSASLRPGECKQVLADVDRGARLLRLVERGHANGDVVCEMLLRQLADGVDVYPAQRERLPLTVAKSIFETRGT